MFANDVENKRNEFQFLNNFLEQAKDCRKKSYFFVVNC